MDTTAIARLVGQENVPRVVAALTTIVEGSFTVCPAARITRSAIQERIDICLALLQRLKGDLHWSLPRVLDHVSAYLVYELQGVRYEPSTGRTWAAPTTTPEGLVLPRLAPGR